METLEKNLKKRDKFLDAIIGFVITLPGSFKTVATNGVDSLLSRENRIGNFVFREINDDGPSAYENTIEILYMTNTVRGTYYSRILDLSSYRGKSDYRVNYLCEEAALKRELYGLLIKRTKQR